MANENNTECDITKLAELAASELLEAVPALKDAKPIERSMAIIQALHSDQGNAARLKALLNNDASFGDLRAGWMQLAGGMGMAIQGHVLPYLIINNVVDGRSPMPLIEEARAFAASRTSITEMYTALAGVTVAEAVSLGPSIDLIPWADVPDGNQKTMFGTDLSHREFGSPMPQQRSIATAAIRIRSVECQVLFASHEDAKPAIEDAGNEIIARTELARDVVRCITALSVCPVGAVGGWSQLDKTIANQFAGTGYSYGGALSDFSIHVASFKPVALDGASIGELFSRFEKLKPSERAVIRITLDRLNQAIRRRNIVDKAIDLGIALEVMLLHGIEENYRGELKFRSSIRGAAFLGGEKPEQLKTFKLLKHAYDLRSKAVHSGALKEKAKEPVKQILEDAASTCASIARKLIDRGSFPNWDADYVIGGG